MKKYLFLLFMFHQISFAQVNINATMQFDGLTREYNIYVPAIYNSNNSVPLVINMHGYGSNMAQQAIYGNFKNLADTDNFIIVCPNGTFDNTNTRYWNAFGATGGVDDVAFISALIDTIGTLYNIDSTKVFATGMSNGGFMSYKLACELNDRIAKIASVTGTMTTPLEASCTPINPIPVMQIHGTADPTVAYGGGGGFTSIEDAVDFWVEHNNCDTTPIVTVLPDINTSDSSTVELYEYLNGDDSSKVVFYKVINGGHTWPGALVDIPSGYTNKDFNASLVIWEFFKGDEVELPTIINDNFTDEAIQLIRNNDILSVSTFQEVENLKVVNALGQVAAKSNFNTINISNLNAGYYFLIIETNKGIFSKSFIK